MDNVEAVVSDAQTEAIVLRHIAAAMKAVQTASEAAVRAGGTTGGRYPIVITRLFLEHLRACLAELSAAYAKRTVAHEANLRAAGKAFDEIIAAMNAKRTMMLRNNREAGPSALEFRDTSSILKAEALQTLEIDLKNKIPAVSPLVEKVIVPLVSGIGGAAVGAILMYYLRPC